VRAAEVVGALCLRRRLRRGGAGSVALTRLGRALVPGGRLFVDGGNPLREVMVPTAR
jgi:hypothetical protein